MTPILMRDWLVGVLAKENGSWGSQTGPGEILLSEYRDLVFYELANNDNEPTPQSPSLVLADFSSRKGDRLCLRRLIARRQKIAEQSFGTEEKETTRLT